MSRTFTVVIMKTRKRSCHGWNRTRSGDHQVGKWHVNC